MTKFDHSFVEYIMKHGKTDCVILNFISLTNKEVTGHSYKWYLSNAFSCFHTSAKMVHMTNALPEHKCYLNCRLHHQLHLST